jgi:hypothetical protein
VSKLLITRKDVEIALKQYYQDYENDLYKKYDFEKADLYFEDQKLGYLGVQFIVPEKGEL